MSSTGRWLWIVGIGEDGWDGLNNEARQAVVAAEFLYGGSRHLALVPAQNSSATRIAGPSPMASAVQQILKEHRHHRRVVVLASGDPLFYGVGVPLTRDLPDDEFRVIPQVSALSLACARLGWPVAETNVVSLVSRPLSQLHRHLYPGQRIVILSEGGRTPLEVAKFLAQAGFGSSTIHVLENLGGTSESVTAGIATTWNEEPSGNLNVVAIFCVRDTVCDALPLIPGLPDDAFETDGQMTKREVRAVTLAQLAPLPGQLLWDVGAGTGTVGIEWMRVHPSCSCLAFEDHGDRSARIRRNAERLGVPGLKVVEGTAPATFAGLTSPNAIFIGGGVASEHLFKACWTALLSGGRLVANAVTIESEACLVSRHARYGGDLMRMMVSRAEPVGSSHAWRPMMQITQWMVTKP
jgi:precorrin-6Y C5,15-methyltransferase (decarboxylating)